MFNLSNLNDHEFEILCKDIMQRKLNVSLRVFKQGQDGGIDIADVITNNSVVIQCKRYIKSTWENLLSGLKKCKMQIDKIKPTQFYVCTSLELSPQQVDALYDIFNTYMKDKSCILDGKLIDEYLSLDSSKDIVMKNYQLWLAASNVMQIINQQDIIIDGEMLLDEIKKNQIFYVQTDFYEKAVRAIFQDKTIMITGAPGVGKTTVSNMVALYLIGQGCSVIYSSGSNIADIKKNLSIDPTKKELVYLDDVLGQAYLELRYDRISEINSLIAYINNSKNKYLIMNSRITILKVAEGKFVKFKENIENVGVKLLDLDKMSSLDKAKILKNHLYFNDVGIPRLASIKSDKNYLKIVEHKNYNPRIIEFVTKPTRFNLYKPEEYFKFILERLNNPEIVWKDEFEDRLAKEDRILMYTIYSLGLHLVDMDVLKEAFEKRIKIESDIDTTKDVFNNVLKRLADNLVQIVDASEKFHGNTKKSLQVGVSNPSINDYMRKFFGGNKSAIDKTLFSAIYVDQYNNMLMNFVASKEFVELLQENKLSQLKHLWVSPRAYYLQYLQKNKDSYIGNKDMVVWAISGELCNGIVLSFIPETIIKLLTPKFIHDYDILNEVTSNNALRYLFDCLELKDSVELVRNIYCALIEKKSAILQIKKFKKYATKRLDEAIESLISVSVDEGLSTTIKEAVSIAASEYSHEGRYEQASIAEDIARQIIENESQQKLEELLPIKISSDWIYEGDDIDFRWATGIDDLREKIEKYIYDEEAMDYYADQWKERRHDEKDEKKIIDEMFD